jgi:hypothetical protein
MKILLLRQPQVPAGFPGGIAGGACYLSDMLFHGLRNLFGDDVVDYERSWWMYSNDFGPGKLDPEIYCPRGFTIYRTLGDDSSVDRTDIENKIRNQYYDLVIFGYTHYGLRPGSWDLVTQHYPANKIAYIDGGDLWSDLKPWAVDKSVYFKREITETYNGLHPIQFAIPKEKIGTIATDKDKIIAPMDPRDKSTYIYDTEETYYKQYAESMFGVTMKKNGWDCVRHYEIMANACVPLFLGLDQCPENIMTTLPKKDLIAILKIVQDNGIEWFTSSVGQECWWEYSNRLDDHFERNCTTDHLATYLLDTVAKYK